MRLIKLPVADGPFASKSLLQEIMGMAPPNHAGFDVAEMRKRIKILDRLESAKGEVLLEEAEWDLVKSVINRPGIWRAAHPDILLVIDAVLGAEAKEPTA